MVILKEDSEKIVGIRVNANIEFAKYTLKVHWTNDNTRKGWRKGEHFQKELEAPENHIEFDWYEDYRFMKFESGYQSFAHVVIGGYRVVCGGWVIVERKYD
jgi:hypothetical protein